MKGVCEVKGGVDTLELSVVMGCCGEVCVCEVKGGVDTIERSAMIGSCSEGCV